VLDFGNPGWDRFITPKERRDTSAVPREASHVAFNYVLLRGTEAMSHRVAAQPEIHGAA
jgi:hypothetical protein